MIHQKKKPEKQQKLFNLKYNGIHKRNIKVPTCGNKGDSTISR